MVLVHSSAGKNTLDSSLTLVFRMMLAWSPPACATIGDPVLTLDRFSVVGSRRSPVVLGLIFRKLTGVSPRAGSRI